MVLKKSILLSLFYLITIQVFGQYRYSYLQLGTRELQNNNYLAAIEDFNESIKNYPYRYEGYYFRSIAKYYLSDYMGAGEDIAKAIEILPKLPDLYLIRGLVRAEQLNINGALKDYAYALQLDSTYFAIHYYRALTYIDLHEFDKALADFNKLKQHEDKFNNYHVIKGVILANLYRYNEAIGELTVAIAQDAGNVIAYVERGTVYMSDNNIKLAMEDFTHALSLDSLNAYAWYQTGVANMQLMDYKSALKDFNKVIELSPGNEMAYFNRAIIKSNTNETTEALSDYNRILSQNPDNVYVYYNKGMTQFRMGKYNEAIESFSKAIELFPDYADAYYERGLVKMAIGDQKGAASDMDRSKSIREKNVQKSDTVKYQEGLQILKLTQFSGDFSEPSARTGKVQYKSINIDLIPAFLLTFNADNSDKIMVYDAKGDSLYPLKLILLSNDFENQDKYQNELRLNKTDSLIRAGETSDRNYLVRGCLNVLLKNYDKSVQDFNTILKDQPDDILALFSRANARLMILEKSINDTTDTNVRNDPEIQEKYKNEFLAVMDDYNRVISLDSNFVFARYNRGYAYYLQHDFEKSFQDFSYVMKNKEWASAYYNSGLLSLILNKNTEACEYLSKAGERGISDAYRVIKLYCDK